MEDYHAKRLMIFILCIVIFNTILIMYWLLMDTYNLQQSSIYEHKVELQTESSDQSQLYLESPIMFVTTNPMTYEGNEINKHHIPWYFKDGTIKPTRARTFYRNGPRTSRVWPEEQIYDDRVEEQLMFIPTRYKYNDAPIKKILLYNNFGSWMVDVGQIEFSSKHCPVNRCIITNNKSEGSTVDAIVFRNEYSRPNHRKTDNQVWVMSVVESAYYTELNVDQNMINWTATYRHDSDIVLPYRRWAYYNPTVTQTDQFQGNYALRKTKQVAMFVSKCDTGNDGLLYAKTLAKYIPVDIYGTCGKSETDELHEFLEMLDRDYKFYLAFEDSNCADYVTDTFFFNGLQHSTLPVVMGGRREDYERVAPERSYVHVDDYRSPEELAEYLRRLDADDALYNEYFRWKGTGEFIDDRFFCRLCAMLHDDGAPVKQYRDLDGWWRGPEVCDRLGAAAPLSAPFTVLDPPPDYGADSEDDDDDESENEPSVDDEMGESGTGEVDEDGGTSSSVV